MSKAFDLNSIQANSIIKRLLFTHRDVDWLLVFSFNKNMKMRAFLAKIIQKPQLE